MLLKNPCWDANPSQHAQNIATFYSKDAYTPEQKTWVIDQMVRALTNCPLVLKEITTNRGELLQFEILGESQAYLVIANSPEWDKGIPI